VTLESFARPLARRTAIWQDEPTPPVIPDELIDLSAGYLPGDTPSHIGQGAADALDRGETHYVDRLGIKPLREAIATTMARDGIPNVTADDLLVTSGAQEALFITLRALVQPQDEVLVPDPGYGLVKPLIELGEGIVVPVSSASEDFSVAAAQYDAAISKRSRFLFVVSPNPATGKVLTSDEFTKLLALAEQYNLTILYDAALQKGIYEPKADANFANGIPERVLWIGSLSKFYRMSGWRIGGLRELRRV
jgi:aspartate aminotransferase/aminotransferase